ncbi:hypothetical protein [Faecalibacter sp. LW9]|uniref:hypothetical protein n=1 Tax=Faecalibacter sp. LW9 TaxID=3103144 RepID=UPI002AFFC288|nr:hypothetical protein [Faecalibacter sp. LW9]
MSYSTKKYHQLLPVYILDLLPEQKRGISRDTIAVFESPQSDLLFHYEKFKNRLEDINHWFHYTSITHLNFQILDADENPVQRKVRIGDLIKIEMKRQKPIPLFGNMMSDWVHVNEMIEFIHDEERFFSLQLIPIESPKLDEVKHFYNEMASNTFIIYQCKNFISLSIHGRNEFPNLISKSRFRMLRNIMIANLSLIGVDNFLWNNFATNLLKP